jgi:hypothetical protein
LWGGDKEIGLDEITAALADQMKGAGNKGLAYARIVKTLSSLGVPAKEVPALLPKLAEIDFREVQAMSADREVSEEQKVEDLLKGIDNLLSGGQ